MPELFSLLANLASAISRSFSFLSSKSTKSSVPRLSFDDRTVGLAIVAAMATDDPLPPPPHARSQPVPILSSPSAAAAMTRQRQAMPVEFSEDDEMTEMEIDETSEDYTCVTAYAGGKAVSRTVYVDDGHGGFLQIRTDPANSTSNSESKKSKRKKIKGVVLKVTSPPPPPTMMQQLTFPGKDFLRRCHLCRKLLHGLDIFMYRGEQPFCSPECRYQYLLNDEHRKKYASDILKPVECALPPSFAPISPSIGAA